MYKEKLDFNRIKSYAADYIFKSPFELIHGFTERRYNIGMHSQEFFEINIILGGTGMHYIGSVRMEVSAGDVFIIPCGVMHGYAGDENFDVYHLLINPAFFDKYSADLRLLPSFPALFNVEPAMREKFRSELYLRLSEKEIDELLPSLGRIARHTKKSDPESVIICMSEAMILIAKLCTKFDHAMNKKAAAPDESGDESFMKSIAHIYEKYYESVTIGELSAIARMSRSAYLAKFKKFTGTSPGDFIIKLRTDTAAGMLTASGRTISEIALSVGFYDPSHFIRTFTKRMGLSPTEYRRISQRRE